MSNTDKRNIGKVLSDLQDFIGKGSLELVDPDNNGFIKVRAIVKSGLTSFSVDTPIVRVIVTNGNVHYNPSGSIPCGDTVTMYFTNLSNGYYESIDTIAKLLSQIDVLIDPLPKALTIEEDYYGDTILILNPDFTTQNGLFSNPKQSPTVLRNSLFRKIPRMFSQDALDKMISFPLADWTIESPTDDKIPVSCFDGCPNIVDVEDQGTLSDELQVLGTINLTYRVEGEEIDRVGAYPSGGSPKAIYGYVVGERLSFSDSYPTYDTSRLTISNQHVRCKEMVIDSGSPNLPIGGVSFKGISNMESVVMPECNFVVDLPSLLPNKLNFAFSWGSLGVEAPIDCKLVSGLHTIWHSFGGNVNADTYIATPDRLSDGVHSGWGSALRTAVSNGLEVTEDFMPLLPKNLESLVGYYNKVLIGEENAIFEDPKAMSSLALKPFLDNDNRWYIVPQIIDNPNLKVLVGYTANLYSDLVIEFDVTIPAIPSNLEYAAHAYNRTFCNAIGVMEPLDMGIKPVLTVMYSNSYDSDPWIIPNLTENYQSDNTFGRLFNSPGVDGIPIRVSEFAGDPYLDTRFNPYYWSPISSQTYYDLHDWISDALDVVNNGVGLTTGRIKSSIVLDKPSGSFPKQVIQFQRNCFYGAAIDPRQVDALITMPTGTVYDDGSYHGALNIFVGVASIPIKRMWTSGNNTSPMTGSSTVKSKYWLEDNENVLFTFVAMITWVGGGGEYTADYEYNLSEILWSGSPRTQNLIDNYYFDPPFPSSPFSNPYYGVLSDRSIKGDQDAFMASKGIYLLEEKFNGASDNVDLDGSFIGPKIGVNWYKTTSDLNGSDVDINLFVPSYDKKVWFGTGINDGGGESGYFYSFYKPPVSINDGEWEGPPRWMSGIRNVDGTDDAQLYRDSWGGEEI